MSRARRGDPAPAPRVLARTDNRPAPMSARISTPPSIAAAARTTARPRSPSPLDVRTAPAARAGLAAPRSARQRCRAAHPSVRSARAASAASGLATVATGSTASAAAEPVRATVAPSPGPTAARPEASLGALRRGSRGLAVSRGSAGPTRRSSSGPPRVRTRASSPPTRGPWCCRTAVVRPRYPRDAGAPRR